jgi:hypothetical protein
LIIKEFTPESDFKSVFGVFLESWRKTLKNYFSKKKKRMSEKLPRLIKKIFFSREEEEEEGKKFSLFSAQQIKS